MRCLSETILSSVTVHMCCFYSLICSQLLLFFIYLCIFRGTFTLRHVSCSSKFSFQLTFYQLHNLHVVWARHQSPVNLKTTIREQLKEVENKEATELRENKTDPTLMIRSPVWTPARIAAPSATQNTEVERRERQGKVKRVCEFHLLSLTSCTKTGLSPLTVSPKPFLSLWIITQRWTRPEHTQTHTWEVTNRPVHPHIIFWKNA